MVFFGCTSLGNLNMNKIPDNDRMTWMTWGYPHDLGKTCGWLWFMKPVIKMTFKGSGVVSGFPKPQKWSISLAAFDYQRVVIGKLSCQVTLDKVNRLVLCDNHPQNLGAAVNSTKCALYSLRSKPGNAKFTDYKLNVHLRVIEFHPIKNRNRPSPGYIPRVYICFVSKLNPINDWRVSSEWVSYPVIQLQ